MSPDTDRQPPAAAGQPQDEEGRSKRSLALLGFVSLFLTIVLLGLGTWQVQRLGWKLDLIARVDARVAAAPVSPPNRDGWGAITADADEYRHVTVSGIFQHEKEALVQASTERGPGFWVITPLIQVDGTRILVNRGFVPPDRRAVESRTEGNGAGIQTVTGLLRLTEPGGGFLRSNVPAEDRWYSRDVAAIAASRGLRDVAPYFIDADATPNAGGYPIGGLTRVVFPNNHLVYAITWFSLAAMLAAATVIIGRREWRRAV
ncbi:SURF1 family protein [Rhizobium sp. YIM 134829]|uniref:SURF1 family protein n=1 Tax=Rhizobium sp. YIM 134829 TaxID=3390453 RepID=UPI00397D2C58